ncbi:MAG: SurA N-terminal domain-containing protein [Chitinophagaceae bacterium]|nr:SurA N-terminal domain-containing protein [Chitinophagaceae bacterium]
MSIIQQIRERAAWVVFIIIGLSLLGFLLMDAKPGQGGLFSSNSTAVGKVDGKEIEFKEYEERMKQMEAQYGQNGMNEMMRQNIEEQVWNQFIQQEVMNKEIKKLGLEVSTKEIEDMLFINPSQELRQSLTNPQTGQYDPNQLKEQIARIKKDKDPATTKQLNDYIMALQKQRLTEKYNSLLSNSSYVPKWMIEKMNVDNSSIASVSYVAVPYATISDSMLKVTDDDINAYVSKRKDEFKQEISRGIYYVAFDASANSKDSAAILKQVADLKESFTAGTDAQAFLIRNRSETEFLDAFIAKSKLQVPNADTIITLADGAVYGPYLDNDKYTLAKMVGRRQLADSVKVRHILIGTTNPQTRQPILADSVAKKRADSIAAAVQSGADFAALALQFSTDEGSKNNGGEYEFSSNQFSDFAKEFAEASFYGKAGDKQVIKTVFGYHYIEVLSQKNFEEAFKIAYLSRTIVTSTETDNNFSNLANQFAGSSRSAKAFDENATKMKYNKLVASDIKPNDKMIAGIGSSRKLVKWIYEADKGDVSEPYPVGDKYIVATVSDISEEGLMSASKARPMVEFIIRNKKKAEQIIAKIGTANTLDAVSKITGSPVQRADSVSFSSGIIPNVGQEAKVVGAVFNKQRATKPSSAIAGNGGVFVIKTEGVTAVPNLAGDVKQQREAILAQTKQSAGFRSLEVLRKAAKVKDDRAKFF